MTLSETKHPDVGEVGQSFGCSLSSATSGLLLGDTRLLLLPTTCFCLRVAVCPVNIGLYSQNENLFSYNESLTSKSLLLNMSVTCLTTLSCTCDVCLNAQGDLVPVFLHASG